MKLYIYIYKYLICFKNYVCKKYVDMYMCAWCIIWVVPNVMFCTPFMMKRSWRLRNSRRHKSLWGNSICKKNAIWNFDTVECCNHDTFTYTSENTGTLEFAKPHFSELSISWAANIVAAGVKFQPLFGCMHLTVLYDLMHQLLISLRRFWIFHLWFRPKNSWQTHLKCFPYANQHIHTRFLGFTCESTKVPWNI